MNTRFYKYLSTVALAAITLQLSACAAMKPDHPQVKESFSDRRSPRDNMLAASGALGPKKDEDSSDFQPIVPTAFADNSGPKIEPGTSTVTRSDAPSGTVDSITNQLPTSITTSVPSAQESQDFFDRLYNSASSIFSTSKVEPAKVSPQENKVAYASVEATYDIAQGDNASPSSGSSFYDIAEQISVVDKVSLSSEFGYVIEPGRFQVAQADTSMPKPPPVPPKFPGVEDKAVEVSMDPKKSPSKEEDRVAPSSMTADIKIEEVQAAQDSAKAASTKDSVEIPNMAIPANESVAIPSTPAVPEAPKLDPLQPDAAPVMKAQEPEMPKAPEMPKVEEAAIEKAEDVKAKVEKPAVTKVAPVQKMEPVQMIEVPEIPSDADMKAESKDESAPKLSDIPAEPEQLKSLAVEDEPAKEEKKAIVEKAKPAKKKVAKKKPKKAKKVAKKLKLPKQDTKDPVAQNPYGDNTHTVDGKQMVTGFLKGKGTSSSSGLRRPAEQNDGRVPAQDNRYY